MIARKDPKESVSKQGHVEGEVFPDLERKCHDFFRPHGLLQQACAGEDFPYESRPQQQKMAEAIAAALRDGAHLAVEAGTGVGKSFAYLVPLIYWSVATQGQVVVSTYTIALQEQLISKDIPFLQKHMGVHFHAVLVKGRSNYACLRRLRRAAAMAQDLFLSEQQAEVKAIQKWAAQTQNGSLQSMEKEPSPEVWDIVCAEHGNCLSRKCPEFERCFLMKARDSIRTAHLLVVNHHLLFSEMGLRERGTSFLPTYGVAVFDEAHMLESVATEHFGVRLSRSMFEHWLRRLFVPESRKGLLNQYGNARAAIQTVTRLWREIRDFYDAVERWAKLKPGQETHRVLTAPLEISSAVVDLLDQCVASVLALSQDPKVREEDRIELRATARRGRALLSELQVFLTRSFADHVYWVEKEGGRRAQLVLHSAPIEVAPILREKLFDAMDTVILTSATLAVSHSMEYFTTRVGAEDCRTLQLGSPFDYSRQMRVYIVRGLPDPNSDEKFSASVARAIIPLIERTRGNAFVLFTNARQMRQVVERARPEIERLGLVLLVQGTGLPRHHMLERFRKGDGCVLFGLDSFWMGVDVRGPALSNVIITRLPFAVPDHPIIQARMERIREQGGDPFREYTLPEAVLKFRQGIGRLIRTQTDEGMVAVLDSRVATKWYGRIFLESIPECPVEAIFMSEDGNMLDAASQ